MAVSNILTGIPHQGVDVPFSSTAHHVPGVSKNHAGVHQNRHGGNYLRKLRLAVLRSLYQLLPHGVATVNQPHNRQKDAQIEEVPAILPACQKAAKA